MRRHGLICGLFLITICTWTSLAAAGQIAAQPSSTAAEEALSVTPTPTIDRLAAPPTVFPPSQADEGAQLFWLYCQPCHGDQGQGLTDEWRAQYPEDHQNCWSHGCHSQSPYPDGFILPTRVPAVIGEGSLFRFATVGQLYYFIRAEMPFEHPGSLTDEEYLALSSFLWRAHNGGESRDLTAENVAQIALHPTPQIDNKKLGRQQESAIVEQLSATPDRVLKTGQSGDAPADQPGFILGAGIFLLLLLVGGGWLVRRFGSRSPE